MAVWYILHGPIVVLVYSETCAFSHAESLRGGLKCDCLRQKCPAAMVN